MNRRFIPVIDAVPERFGLTWEGTRASATVPLTVSEDGSIQVAVEVRLWAGHWHGYPVFEFKFAIVVHDRGRGRLDEIFDRIEAAPFIGSVRHLVMPLVSSAARVLVKAVLPNAIYRATYLTRPPERSLVKHQMITDTLQNLGYEIAQQGTDSHLRWFWLMTRDGGD